MRKLQSLVYFLLLSMTVYAADQVIQLPKPNMNRSGQLVKVLSERHSVREYASQALSNANLSDLLWAASGISRPAEGKHTAPSATNCQDVDIYVIPLQGTYLYDIKKHKLDLIFEDDYCSAVAGGRAFINSAPLSLALASDLSKLGDVKNNRTQMTGTMDVGIISQNVSLFCPAARLATVPRAAMDTARLRGTLKLKDGQIPMMNHPIGYFE